MLWHVVRVQVHLRRLPMHLQPSRQHTVVPDPQYGPQWGMQSF